MHVSFLKKLLCKHKSKLVVVGSSFAQRAPLAFALCSLGYSPGVPVTLNRISR